MPYDAYYRGVLFEDTTPAFQFVNNVLAALLLEGWDSSFGIGLASGATDTWVGQKLGITLSAVAAGNRPAYGADGTFFRSRNVVQGAVSGTKYLRNTDFGFDLLPAVSAPYTFTIVRQRTNLSDKGLIHYGSTASQFEFLPYTGTSGVSACQVRTASVQKTVLSGDAYTSSVKMQEAWCDGSGINVRNNVTGTTATTSGGTATTGALRKLSFFADNGGGNVNDASIRFHAICSSKPSDALLSQIYTYFQQDSGV